MSVIVESFGNSSGYLLTPNLYLLATDASVDGLSGRSSVVLCDHRGHILCVYLPVDGNLSEITSYRTELCAIWGGFLLLAQLIPPALRPTVKGSLWTDSD